MLGTVLVLLTAQAAPYRTGPVEPAPYRTAPIQPTGAVPYRTGPVAPGQAAPYRIGVAQPGYRIAPAAASAPVEAPGWPAPILARTGVSIDAYDPAVEHRWGPDDPYYASTVRGGAAAAQSRQGEMDGGWLIGRAAGEPLYTLQLVDTGQGALEGAWRRATADGSGPTSSGFITLVGREAGRMAIRFLEPGAASPTAVTLERASDGTWRGELSGAQGSSEPVVMRRR